MEKESQWSRRGKVYRANSLKALKTLYGATQKESKPDSGIELDGSNSSVAKRNDLGMKNDTLKSKS